MGAYAYKKRAAAQDVLAGKSAPTSQMLGHRDTLAPSLQGKMSQSFGMDLSGVQLYRSDEMVGSGISGLASGNRIILSSDVDLNTMEGQAILGHEISHIRAQSQGIGTGSGLLQDASLERQADSEGLLAARGMSISGERMGMSTGFGMRGVEALTPVSAGLSASAGAPMQARKKETDEDVIGKAAFKDGKNDKTYAQYSEEEAGAGKAFGMADFLAKGVKAFPRNEKKHTAIRKNFSAKYLEGRKFGGAAANRIVDELCQPVGNDVSADEANKILENYFKSDNEEDKKSAQLAMKDIYYKELLRREKKFGKLPSQMHLQDIVERSGQKGTAGQLQLGESIKDINQITSDKNYNVEFDDPEKEAHYQALRKYYEGFEKMFVGFADSIVTDPDFNINDYEEQYEEFMTPMLENEQFITQGPSFNEEQQNAYNQKIQEKINSGEYFKMPELKKKKRIEI